MDVRSGKVGTVEGRAVLALYECSRDESNTLRKYLYAYSTGVRLFSRISDEDDSVWMEGRLELHERFRELGCKMRGVGSWGVRITGEEYVFHIRDNEGVCYMWKTLSSSNVSVTTRAYPLYCSRVEDFYREAVSYIRDHLSLDQMSQISKKQVDLLVNLANL